jgi:hypothetical protein
MVIVWIETVQQFLVWTIVGIGLQDMNENLDGMLRKLELGKNGGFLGRGIQKRDNPQGGIDGEEVTVRQGVGKIENRLLH